MGPFIFIAMIDANSFEKELLKKFRKDLEYRHYMLTYYQVPFVVLMTKLPEEPPVKTAALIQPIMQRIYASILLKRWCRSFARINNCFLNGVRKDIIRVFGEKSSQAITVAACIPLMKAIFQAIEQLPVDERVTYKTCMIAAYRKETTLVPAVLFSDQATVIRLRSEQMIRTYLMRWQKDALPFFEDLLRCRNANA
jgi:hypothetical protein